MDRQKLKEIIIDIICQSGDCSTEFETRDIQELIHWITELESAIEKLKHIY